MSTSAISVTPTIITTELQIPPSLGQSRSQSNQSVNGQSRPQANTRVSFFDPANQAALDRLVTIDLAAQGGAEGGLDDLESGQGTLASVEEMLEGYEWASEDILGKRSRGPADQIEARLLSELMALDKARFASTYIRNTKLIQS